MTRLDLTAPATKAWDDADRVALVAVLDQAIEDAARVDAPPEPDRRAWLHGSLGFTEPDRHGWMAPTMPQVWMPRALCFWRSAIDTGNLIRRDWCKNPRHALTPWPAVERAVAGYLALYPWLIDVPADQPLIAEALCSGGDL